MLSFTKMLDELDRIMVKDVNVVDIVNTLEDIKEYVVTYYKVRDTDNVFQIFSMINYILGDLGLDYVKKNHLNSYRLLRMQILNWRWESLHIDHRCVRGDDDNVEEDSEDNVEE